MAKSILQDTKECYFCGRTTGLEAHHVWGGVANRPISEKYGLKVWLCHDCHTGTEGAQYAFEREHTRSEWMKLIGKNYL